MSFLNSLSPKEFVILANIVAITLTEGKSAADNSTLGTFISTVSSIMLTIAAQQQNLQSLEDKKKQIKELEEQLNQLKNDL